MKPIYEVVKDENNSVIKCTREDGSIVWIPMDEANSDYQRYLRWLEDPEADQFTPTIEVTND
jgi:hypothetical protein